MRNITRAAVAMAGAVTLTVGFAAPAFADTTGDTDVTVEVEAGELSITLPATADLGSAAPGAAAAATLGSTTVTDTRAGTDGWVVTYSVTDFEDAALGAGENILGSALTVTPGPATATTGQGTFAPAAPTTGATGNIFSATGVHGNNSASWTTGLSLAVPAAGLAGTYSATFTQSVTTDAVG